MPENEGTSSLEEVMAKANAQAAEQAAKSAEAAARASEEALAQEATAAAEEQAATPQTYVVQSGDSLSAIAEKIYGDAKYWDTIFEHNKDKIKDPNLIYPGQELVIP